MKIYFKEEQKFRQAWVWILIAVLTAITVGYFIYGIDKQLIQGEQFGDKPMSNMGLIIAGIVSAVVIIGVAALLYLTRMILIVASDGIHRSTPTLINKETIKPPEGIARYEIPRDKPIREVGGWGIRTGNKKNGLAYNVSGNLGLQIFLNTGKKIMFGTQRKEAIGLAMKKMMGKDNDLLN